MFHLVLALLLSACKWRLNIYNPTKIDNIFITRYKRWRMVHFKLKVVNIITISYITRLRENWRGRNLLQEKRDLWAGQWRNTSRSRVATRADETFTLKAAPPPWTHATGVTVGAIQGMVPTFSLMRLGTVNPDPYTRWHVMNTRSWLHW